MEAAKNLLLIHYYYPPIQSAAVLRNYYFSLEFARRFNQIFLVTTSNRKRLSAEELPLSSKISIREAFTFDYRTLRFKRSGSPHQSENKKKYGFYPFFRKLQKTLPFHFFIGEGGVFYILHGYWHGVRIIKRHGIEVIYSSFGPYADHLISYLLKCRFPAVCWIADFRDLQVEPLYKNVYFERWQNWIERQLLRKANLVTTVSGGLAKHLEKYGRPTLAIPRGVQLNKHKYLAYDRFTICYTGSLYQDFRDGTFFFSELAKLIESNQVELDKIQFIYAGRDGNRFQQWIDQYNLRLIYKDLGLISRRETLEVQAKSHLQLLLTSSTIDWQGVLTGKLFEYLESGNGILVLIKGVEDREFEQLIADTGSGAVFYDPPKQTESLSTYLLSQYRKWETTGNLDIALNRDYIRQHLSWSSQVDRILTAINQN